MGSQAGATDRANAPSLLQVRDLTVQFPGEGGSSVPAVDGIGFDLEAGKVVGLLGESGSGKTTAALALLGLLPASARIVKGSVKFRGSELLFLDDDRMQEIRGAEISAIFQEPGLALNPVLRAGRQVEEVIHAHRPWGRSRCREEAEAVLAQVGLADGTRIYDAYPHELSGGQRQRVVIAQAIACRPALLLADEPTTALDLVLRAEILGLLRELKERLGLALLVISHDLGTLAGLADRVMVMYAGRIVEEGTLDQIRRDPLHPYTRGLLGSVPQPPTADPAGRDRKLASIPGSPPDLSRLPAGCAFEPRCPDRMEICTTRPPEEVRPEASRRVRCFKHGG